MRLTNNGLDFDVHVSKGIVTGNGMLESAEVRLIFVVPKLDTICPGLTIRSYKLEHQENIIKW